MAIAIQNEYQGATVPEIVVSSALNLGLVIITVHEDGGAEVATAPTSMTANGDAMTQAIMQRDTKANSDTAVSVWYRINPDVGTYTPVANGVIAETSRFYAYVLTGFKQSAPVANTDSEGNELAGTTGLTVSLTDVDGGFATGAFAFAQGGTRNATWTNLTEDFDEDLGSGGHRSGASALISGTSARSVSCVSDSSATHWIVLAAVMFSAEPAGGISIPIVMHHYRHNLGQ